MCEICAAIRDLKMFCDSAERNHSSRTRRVCSSAMVIQMAIPPPMVTKAPTPSRMNLQNFGPLNVTDRVLPESVLSHFGQYLILRNIESCEHACCWRVRRNNFFAKVTQDYAEHRHADSASGRATNPQNNQQALSEISESIKL